MNIIEINWECPVCKSLQLLCCKGDNGYYCTCEDCGEQFTADTKVVHRKS